MGGHCGGRQPITANEDCDTGASLSLVSHATYKRLWPLRKLQESRVNMCTYSGDPIVVLGYLEVKVQYKTKMPGSHSLWSKVRDKVFLEETGYSTYAWIGIKSIVSAQAVWRECLIRKKHCSSPG